LNVFFKGFSLGLGLIVAIGAQNAFVLSNALKKNHTLILVLACIVFDVIGITLGVAGIGAFVAGKEWLMNVFSWGGAAFLLFYGFTSFQSAFKDQRMDSGAGEDRDNVKTLLLALMAVTFLNPHYYLDTVILIGSIAAHYVGGERITFWLGTISASFVWFFTLGFGAALLIPLFKKSITWKILDFSIGCVMWYIAYGLVQTALA